MAAKKIKLADVLWDAANKHLAAHGHFDEEGYMYTCEAVAVAANHPWSNALSDDGGIWADFINSHPASDFMRSLGCDPKRGSLFLSFTGEERQGVRYMWLLIAMHVAEDLDIEIEVPQ